MSTPMTTEVQEAAAAFARLVAAVYGRRLRVMVVYGSQARGTARQDSDLDIGVILDTGIEIQPIAISLDQWVEPDRHTNPDLVRAMRRDGRPVAFDTDPPAARP